MAYDYWTTPTAPTPEYQMTSGGGEADTPRVRLFDGEPRLTEDYSASLNNPFDPRVRGDRYYTTGEGLDDNTSYFTQPNALFDGKINTDERGYNYMSMNDLNSWKQKYAQMNPVDDRFGMMMPMLLGGLVGGLGMGAFGSFGAGAEAAGGLGATFGGAGAITPLSTGVSSLGTGLASAITPTSLGGGLMSGYTGALGLGGGAATLGGIESALGGVGSGFGGGFGGTAGATSKAGTLESLLGYNPLSTVASQGLQQLGGSGGGMDFNFADAINPDYVSQPAFDFSQVGNGATGFDPSSWSTAGDWASGATGTGLASSITPNLLSQGSPLAGLLGANDFANLTSNPSFMEGLIKTFGKNAVSSALSSGIQGLTSLLASNTQAKAGQTANDTLWQMYNLNRNDQAPYREAGYGALGNLTNMTKPGYDAAALMNDPGAAYRQQMGQQALDNQLRAAGKFYSGGALKAGQEFNQGIASQEFGNAWNRNAALAGIGQTATNATTSLGAGASQNVANNQLDIGNVRASGYKGVGSAVNNGLNSYNAANQQDALMALLPQLLKG